MNQNNRNIGDNNILIIKSYLWFLFYYFLDCLKLFIPCPFDKNFEEDCIEDGFEDESIKDIDVEEIEEKEKLLRKETKEEQIKDKNQINIDIFQVSEVNITIKRNSK